VKKIVWVDVGVHFGQEYKSIFSSNAYFSWKLIRRCVGAYLFKKGSFFTPKEFIHLLKLRSKIRERRDKFYVVFVEANPKIIVSKKIFLEVEAVFNIALTGAGDEKPSIVKLFLADGDLLSQGNSIYESKGNISSKQYISTIGVQSSVFMKELRIDLDKKYDEYEIMLRLNCEGVEDDVIYAAKEVFNENLKLVCGSLKDVKGVKGEQAHIKLMEFLKSQNIENVFFSPSVLSWPLAFQSIMRLIK
jgi:hypothetical protein